MSRIAQYFDDYLAYKAIGRVNKFSGCEGDIVSTNHQSNNQQSLQDYQSYKNLN